MSRKSRAIRSSSIFEGPESKAILVRGRLSRSGSNWVEHRGLARSPYSHKGHLWPRWGPPSCCISFQLPRGSSCSPLFSTSLRLASCSQSSVCPAPLPGTPPRSPNYSSCDPRCFPPAPSYWRCLLRACEPSSAFRWHFCDRGSSSGHFVSSCGGNGVCDTPPPRWGGHRRPLASGV